MSASTVFLGFGEAASAFATDPRWTGPAAGYDLKLDDAEQKARMITAFAAADVTACRDCAQAVSRGDSVLSLVTAEKSINAAHSAAGGIRAGSLYFDMNSVAPARKTEAAHIITHAGGLYVDAAVMAPVYPAQLDVPILVSGLHANAGERALRSLGFTNVRQVGKEIGRASVIKMVRSVMVKGIEALTAECVLAADAAGVTEEVLGSLGAEWAERANYNIERMLIHGKRRAAEMEEVCATLEGLGIEPVLTRGTVQRQRELGKHGHQSAPATLEEKLSLIATDRKVQPA